MVEWNGTERCVKVNQSGTTDERERNESGPSWEPDKTSRDKTSHAIFLHPGQNIPQRFATPDKTSHAIFLHPEQNIPQRFATSDKTPMNANGTRADPAGSRTKHPGTKHPMPFFYTPDITSHAVFVTPDITSHAIFATPDKTSHTQSAPSG